MSDQQVKYTITADASQANSELAKVDKAAASLVGNEKALATETAKATAAITEQGKATATSSVSMKSLGDGAKALQQKMAPAAAAISGVSAALGSSSGAAGQAVNAFGQMAAAFGSGGPVGVAVVGLTLAVNELMKSWENQTIAQDKALDRQYASVLKTIDSARAARAALTDSQAALTAALRIGESEKTAMLRTIKEAQDAGAARVEAAQARLDKLKSTALDLKIIEKDAEVFGQTFSQARRDATSVRNSHIRLAERELAMTNTTAMLLPTILTVEEKRLKAVEAREKGEQGAKEALERQLRIYDAMGVSLKEGAKIANDAFDAGSTNDELSRTMRGLRAVEGDGLGGAMRAGDADDNDILTVTGKQATLIQLERDFEGVLGSIRDEVAEKEAESAKLHLSRLEDLEGEGLAARMAFDTLAMDHKMENLDKLKDHELKNLKDTAKQYESMYNDLVALAEGATSTLIGASQDYFKAKIEGAENAEALAAAAFLSGVGEQLVGLGTKNLFEGAGMLVTSGGVDPRGYALTALGAGAIAAGVGMGAGSAAISHTAAGGTIGKELPDKKAAKDKGASPGRGGGGSGGGPLVVNVAYGAGGPLPEDTAREIQKAVDTGRRRGGR